MFFINNLPKSLKPKFKFDLIRVGRNNDGGYLLGLNTLKNTKILISLGINDDWSFERHFHEMNRSCKISMFDDKLDLFFLIKKFFFFKYLKLKLDTIKNIYNYIFFVKKKISKKKVNREKFKSIIRNYQKDIFLKIDIEGDEYSLLKEIIFFKNRFNGLIVEFHSVDKNIKIIENFIKEMSFSVTNIHINNFMNFGKYLIPKCIEITLEKKPKILNYSFIKESNLNEKNNIYKKYQTIFFK